MIYLIQINAMESIEAVEALKPLQLIIPEGEGIVRVEGLKDYQLVKLIGFC